MNRFSMTAVSAIVALGGLSANSMAQIYYSNFEAPAYVAGSNVVGIDGWYLPSTANSVTGVVVAYASNPWSIPGTARTGAKGAGNANPGGVFNTRMQRDVAFDSTRSYTMSWDSTVRYTGTLPGTQNVGSVSLQDSLVARYFIALKVWTDPNTCATWDQQFNVWDGTNVALVNQSPGAAWTNLLLDRLYRNSVTWNFATNQIERVTICDLATSTFNSFSPTNWYLTGGTTPTLPMPTAMRIFVGGTTAGNTLAYDNILLAPKENQIETVATTAGLAFGGGLASLYNEDGNRYIVLNDEFDSNAHVDCQTTANQGTASAMLVRLVSSATRNDLATFVKLKNQTNATYTDVGFALSTFTNSDLVALPANAGNFVNTSTNKIDVRILWIPTQDIDAGDGWTESIDEVKVHVSP